MLIRRTPSHPHLSFQRSFRLYCKTTISASVLFKPPFTTSHKRNMSTTSTSPEIRPEDITSFQTHLKSSTRILALLGAGLSASSGLPTFRGAGGLWRTHNSISLATPGAFNEDPGLVWQFYSYRRHMSLQAAPNPAHYALAELARQKPEFQCLSQNVDGLSVRARHPEKQLQLLHGSLFDIKCSNKHCGYIREDFTDPIVPALAIPTTGEDPTSNKARGQDQDISDINVSIPKLKPHDLPQCPKCNRSLLRPGVVWFGENLPFTVLDTVDAYLASPEKIDLMLVIGTSAKVHPAAGYIDEARERGARVAVINMDENDRPAHGWSEGDWFFCGDAAQIVPELLKPVIGEVGSHEQEDKAQM